MHFLFEACYRRPLEPRSLVICRGGTAIFMGILFVVYCGYLGNQIYHGHPLIRLSADDIIDQYPFPDIEMCLERSRIVINRCDLWDIGFNRVTVPNNCSEFLENGGEPVADGPSCTLFRSKNIQYSVKPGTWGTLTGPERTKYIEIFWSIANITNANLATVAVPYLDIQLYHPTFNRWDPEVNNTKIPQQRQQLRELELGNYRLTSTQNYTTKIYASPVKYRAIPPGDARSLLGFDTEYAESVTISAVQNSWPIKPNDANLANGLYSGRFSVWIAKSTVEVRTEEPQHTILSAVAMAGGLYGLLTTLYMLLFGMTRHTPWGLVHHIPMLISRGTSKLQCSSKKPDKDTLDDSKKTRPPWFLRQHLWRKSTRNEKRQTDFELEQQNTKGREGATPLPTRVLQSNSRRSSGSSQELLRQGSNFATSSPVDNDALSTVVMTDELQMEKERTESLSRRVEELEILLREYFLDTDYLDRVRQRHPSRYRDAITDHTGDGR